MGLKSQLTDKELFQQMIERDVAELYDSVASNSAILQMEPIRQKIYSYADFGIEWLMNMLFETDETSIDEAASMASLISEDKIKQYRDRIRAEKASM